MPPLYSCALFALLPVTACAPAGVIRGAATPISPSWLGINNGAVEVRDFSLTDERLQAVTVNQRAGVFRYPTGTGSGYWDWRTACVTGDKSCGTVNNTVRALSAYVKATGVEPVIAVNMLTDNLTSQLEFLAACASAAVPVTRVELGNEYYLQNPDYLKAFPTAADYGLVATQWIAAITSVYPDVSIAAIASPVKPGSPSPREQTWNAGLLSTLRGASALTMHEYTDTRIGKAGPFTPADVPVLLGAPFYWVNAIAAQVALLPPSVGGIWVTEFNLKDSQVTGVSGTWAHGLYLATEAMLLVSNASARIQLAIPWQFLGDASMGSIFSTTTGFSFTGSPDPTLPTTPYNRTAAAFTLGAFATASKGRTSASPLTISPNPFAQGADGRYDTIVGVAFEGGKAGASAVLLNLGASAYDLDVESIGSFTRFETFSASPTSPVNTDSVVTFAQGTPGISMLLPPYSIAALTS